MPYCPKTSSFNSTEDCLTLDLYIPKDFDGDSLVIYLPPNPASSPYAPDTLAWFDASIASAKLNSGNSYNSRYFRYCWLVFAIVRSRSYLFGYLNYKDIGNFGLADEKKAISFMKKSFKIMFGRDPKVTIIGDGFGAEHAGFHLFDEEVTGMSAFKVCLC